MFPEGLRKWWEGKWEQFYLIVTSIDYLPGADIQYIEDDSDYDINHFYPEYTKKECFLNTWRKIMFYCYTFMHIFLLTSFMFLGETSSNNNMDYVTNSYPKNTEIKYKNEIIYKKAPTPWIKILNTK